MAERLDLSGTPVPEERLVRSMFSILEDEFEVCCRYVEPAQKNLYTYSAQFYRLHQDACREIDTLFKLRLKQYDLWPTKAGRKLKEPSFAHYYPLKSKLMLANREVRLMNRDLKCSPYSDWRENKAPSWWSDHNVLKHDRINSFEKATLDNVIHSLAALYLLLNDPRIIVYSPAPTRTFNPLF